jgi:hypothetical protein
MAVTFLFSETRNPAARQRVTIVLETLAILIFMVTSRTSKQQALPELWYLSTKLNGHTFQHTIIFL